MTLGINSGVQFGPTGTKLMKFINDWYPASGDLYVTSAYRPEETGSHHAGLVYNGSPTAAIDMGALDFGETVGVERMRLLAKWLYDNFWDLIVEEIHTVTLPSTGYYVKNQVKVGPYAAADHWNHVHFATSSALVDQMNTRAEALFGNNTPPITSTPPPPGENGPFDGVPGLPNWASASPAVQYGPTGTKLKAFLNKWYAPADRGELYVTLAYTPGSGDAHGGLTWNGSATAALDLGALDFGATVGQDRMKAMAAWLYQNFKAQLHELAHVTPSSSDPDYSVKLGVDVAQFMPDANNRIHLSASSASIDAMETKAQQLWGNETPPASGGDPGGQPMEPGPIYGWDMSDFNNSPTSDVTQSYAAGIRFFTHKLIELDSGGGHFEHTKCAARVLAAKDAGIPFVGVYVVPRTGVSAQTLANEALRLLDLRMPGLKNYKGFFWQVDTEKWSYDNVSPTLGEQVAVALEALTPGRKAVHYAPQWAYGNTVPNTARPLWASSYGNNANQAYKALYTANGGANHVGWGSYSGRVPKILQYGSNGIIVNGRGGDVNAFKGSTKDFATMIGWSTYGDPQ